MLTKGLKAFGCFSAIQFLAGAEREVQGSYLLPIECRHLRVKQRWRLFCMCEPLLKLSLAGFQPVHLRLH